MRFGLGEHEGRGGEGWGRLPWRWLAPLVTFAIAVVAGRDVQLTNALLPKVEEELEEARGKAIVQVEHIRLTPR